MSAPKPPSSARDRYVGYLRYTGMGFTMMGIILVFTFLGRWLDGVVAWNFPVFTLVLALVGVTGAMIYLFKETGKRT